MKKISRFLRRYFTIFKALFGYGRKALRQYVKGEAGAVISPRELRGVLEDLGGSFLKFGQLAAVRPDFFPEEYCRELLGLLDEARPIEPELLDGIFLREYSRKPEEVFRVFERTPLAAASFGEVHEAWLDEGERVAVKIQRPHAVEDFSFDARFFSFLAWLIRRTGIIKAVDPVKVIREFIRWTERELDYLQEAEHLERLRNQAERNRLPIRIPRVFREYTTHKILVMEFIEGQTLKSYYLAREAPPGAEKMFKNLIFFGLHSFFLEGFFHADPHPANVLVTPSGGVALIDAGIAARVSVSDRKRLARFLRNVAAGDAEGTVKAFLDLVEVPLLDMLAEARTNYPQYWLRIQFLKNVFLKKVNNGIAELMTRWHEAFQEGGKLEGKSVMHKFVELFQIAEHSGIKLPESGTILIRSFLSNDVAVFELLPKFNIPRVVNEFFERYGEELKKLDELEEPVPRSLGAPFNHERAEIRRALAKEFERLHKELLLEKASSIMETFE